MWCRITDLEALLRTPERVLQLVEKEARQVADTFGRPRRSMMMDAPVGGSDVESISVIPNEPSIIVFSKRGYIKRMRADTFNVQNRNGRGALQGPLPPPPAAAAASQSCCAHQNYADALIAMSAAPASMLALSRRPALCAAKAWRMLFQGGSCVINFSV